MKKLFLSTVLFACAAPIFAQNKIDRSYFGLKAGVNSSTISTSSNVPGIETNNKNGFAGGVYYNFGLGKVFSIQPELLYSAMGSKIKQTLTSPNGEATLKLNYISIPVLFKISPVWRFAIFAGPEFDLLATAKSQTSGQSDADQIHKIKGSDFAATAGMEFWLTRNIGLYGRYIAGLKDVNENFSVLSTSFYGSEIKNKGWQFGLSIGFRNKIKEPEVASAPPAPVDSDGDGITDNLDKCPSVAGLSKYQGCPIPDTDGDGINDENDKCPAVAGLEKYQGCPVPDTDGDGINDENDKCPTVAGLAKYEGCPMPDTDGDGINDEADKCPKTPGIAQNLGCPEMVLYYKRADATLGDDDKAQLDKVVTFLNNNPGLNVIIEGHTSTLGETKYNQTLSEKRANNTVDYLVSKGIARERLKAIGYGEQYPIGDNSTEEGRAQSRRVEVKIAQ